MAPPVEKKTLGLVNLNVADTPHVGDLRLINSYEGDYVFGLGAMLIFTLRLLTKQQGCLCFSGALPLLQIFAMFLCKSGLPAV
ncbi:hypothetical protein [Sodalis sp. dw_96]|uniref:hypothetical protein n=1 Tax=Sodalis sp. dw_96 TaxID=2719794 RepID=UPI001BD21632|nr:hypothetical protein [Sodalis sp. dw_96]